MRLARSAALAAAMALSLTTAASAQFLRYDPTPPSNNLKSPGSVIDPRDPDYARGTPAGGLALPLVPEVTGALFGQGPQPAPFAR